MIPPGLRRGNSGGHARSKPGCAWRLAKHRLACFAGSACGGCVDAGTAWPTFGPAVSQSAITCDVRPQRRPTPSTHSIGSAHGAASDRAYGEEARWQQTRRNDLSAHCLQHRWCMVNTRVEGANCCMPEEHGDDSLSALEAESMKQGARCMTSAHSQCRTIPHLRLGLLRVRRSRWPLKDPFEATSSRDCQRIQTSVQSCNGSACSTLTMHGTLPLRHRCMHFKWLHPAHAAMT